MEGTTIYVPIKVHMTADEAPHYYLMDPKPTGIKIDHAVVVKNGTVEGKGTVDLVFTDEEGKTYVALLTANMLHMIAVAGGAPA